MILQFPKISTTLSLGNKQMINPDYSEYFIEYDLDNNTVYVSGLTGGEFWEEVAVQTDVAEPESFAWGFYEALKTQGIFSTVERFFVDDTTD